MPGKQRPIFSIYFFKYSSTCKLIEIGLFGSHVRGEARDDSDIDFLVVFEKGKQTFDNFMELSR